MLKFCIFWLIRLSNQISLLMVCYIAFVVVKNACVTYLFQILPFTDPKNLSYVKRIHFLAMQINCSTKEILNTFSTHTFDMCLNKSLATLTSFLGVCYSACLKSQVKVKKYQDYL